MEMDSYGEEYGDEDDDGFVCKINFDELEQQSDSSSSSNTGNLACQLFEGEEVSAQMANFLAIHMLNEMPQPDDDENGEQDDQNN